MVDILTVKRMLADRAQAVAEMLLPNGRKEGAEWRAGSVDGEKGKSLGVHLSGQKAGVWADFGTGECGDLLDLWKNVRRMSLPEALEDAKAWLGITRPQAYRDPTPVYQRPPRPSCKAVDGKALDYLRGERAIPVDVLTRYKVAARGDEIIFPFLLPDGVLALAKARKAEPGARPVPTASECEPILFGWQAVPPDAREIIITEGEIDALSWAAFGFTAMSVPYGGGKGAKQNWIQGDFERMERFEKIYLSLDMDPVGDEAAEEIASRLGRHRCYRVSLPRKDANDCLVHGDSPEVMRAALVNAQALDPEGLKSASSFTDQVVHLFWPAGDKAEGYGLPYGKIDGKLIFRPSEVTLWAGASGAGKSQILSDCVVHWVSQGGRTCVASLEMKPAQTLKRMCKQAGGVDRPTAEYIGAILTWLDQGLLLYDKVGKAGVEGLLQVFDYARAKYGCDQFVIDSLMRLGIAGDDYTGQEKAVFQMVDWAVANNVHLHLVAHARKSAPGQGAPETEDIKGAMEIGANAFNIVSVWRNRKLEDDIKAAQSEAERRSLNEKPGVIMNVAKQRNGDFEGKIGLWFDQENYRYRSSHEAGQFPRQYIRDFRSPQQQERTA